MAKIIQAAIYSYDDVIGSDEYPKGFGKQLESQGFLLSPRKEAYYHPDHWTAPKDENDFIFDENTYAIFDDAFMPKTPEAKAWNLLYNDDPFCADQS